MLHAASIARRASFKLNRAARTAATTCGETQRPLEASAAWQHFELLRRSRFDEFDCNLALLRHRGTGAQLLSVEAPHDDNKVFGAVFETATPSSSGIAHVLEHSVLCGSRRYPLKEPFVELLKGSLNTFLNAFTYPDRTLYPVASQNTRDFEQLLDVYLDAVLQPVAAHDPLILQQEGWRHERDQSAAAADTANGDTVAQQGGAEQREEQELRLRYQGVVLNEMKGVYSSPASLHRQRCQQALYPDVHKIATAGTPETAPHPYACDSGGSPEEILNLTFEQLRDFHQQRYHPSVARFYFYGDDDPARRLELLHARLEPWSALDSGAQEVNGRESVDGSGLGGANWNWNWEHTAPPPPPPAVPLQRLRSEPWREAHYFSASEGASDGMDDALPEADTGRAKQHVSVNWLLADDVTDPAPARTDNDTDSGNEDDAWRLAAQLGGEEAVALGVLGQLLLGTASSPLYRALMDSELGDAVIGGGFDTQLRQPSFSVGLEGVAVSPEPGADPSEAVAEALTRKVEDVIIHTLSELSVDGAFSAEDVAARMNSTEFAQRELCADGGGRPKGLMLLIGVAPQWIYTDRRDDNVDLAASVRFEKAFARLRARVEAGEPVFERLIRKRLVDNGHRVTVSLRPDAAHLGGNDGAGGDGWMGRQQRADEAMRLQREAQELCAAAGGSGAAAAQKIDAHTDALRKRQLEPDSPEALETLQMLTADDLEAVQRHVPTNSTSWTVPLLLPAASAASQSSSLTVLQHELPSSGILYATLAFDLQRALPLATGHGLDWRALPELAPLLPLFCSGLTEWGTTRFDEAALTQRVGTHTGGIGASVFICPSTRGSDSSLAVASPHAAEAWLVLRGKALAPKADVLLGTMLEMVRGVELDTDHARMRLAEGAAEYHASLEQSVIASGHAAALSALSARFDSAGWLSHQRGGSLTQLPALRQLAEQAAAGGAEWECTASRLEALRKGLLDAASCNATEDGGLSGMILSLAGDARALHEADAVAGHVTAVLGGGAHDWYGGNTSEPLLQQDSSAPTPATPSAEAVAQWGGRSTNASASKWSDELEFEPQQGRRNTDGGAKECTYAHGYAVPSAVNYVCRKGRAFEHGEVVTGSMSVAARALSTGHLWEQVRVVGGAYGASCGVDALSGTFSFSSYRDPNIGETLRAYDAAPEALRNMAARMESGRAEGRRELNAAIVGAIGDRDHPQGTSTKAYGALQRWITGISDETRQQTRDEMLGTSPSHFRELAERIESVNSNGAVAVVGGESALHEYAAEPDAEPMRIHTNVLE